MPISSMVRSVARVARGWRVCKKSNLDDAEALKIGTAPMPPICYSLKTGGVYFSTDSSRRSVSYSISAALSLRPNAAPANGGFKAKKALKIGTASTPPIFYSTLKTGGVHFSPDSRRSESFSVTASLSLRPNPAPANGGFRARLSGFSSALLSRNLYCSNSGKGKDAKFYEIRVKKVVKADGPPSAIDYLEKLADSGVTVTENMILSVLMGLRDGLGKDRDKGCYMNLVDDMSNDLDRNNKRDNYRNMSTEMSLCRLLIHNCERKFGLKPTANMFTFVAEACYGMKDFKSGKQLLEDMDDVYGIEPNHKSLSLHLRQMTALTEETKFYENCVMKVVETDGPSSAIDYLEKLSDSVTVTENMIFSVLMGLRDGLGKDRDKGCYMNMVDDMDNDMDRKRNRDNYKDMSPEMQRCRLLLHNCERKFGLKPTVNMFNFVVQACNDRKDFKSGKQLLKDMADVYGIKANHKSLSLRALQMLALTKD